MRPDPPSFRGFFFGQFPCLYITRKGWTYVNLIWNGCKWCASKLDLCEGRSTSSVAFRYVHTFWQILSILPVSVWDGVVVVFDNVKARKSLLSNHGVFQRDFQLFLTIFMPTVSFIAAYALYRNDKFQPKVWNQTWFFEGAKSCYHGVLPRDFKQCSCWHSLICLAACQAQQAWDSSAGSLQSEMLLKVQNPAKAEYRGVLQRHFKVFHTISCQQSFF